VAVTITSQGKFLKQSVHDITKFATRRNGARAQCSTFSDRSRRSLLDLINKLDTEKIGYGRSSFVTLTYPEKYPSWRRAKMNLAALFERWRRAWPEMSVIWRIENQKRGAPHFHLILFNAPYIPQKELAAAWREIIGAKPEEYLTKSGKLSLTTGADIRLIRSARGVTSYVSKYVAKPAAAADPGGLLTSLDSLTKTHASETVYIGAGGFQCNESEKNAGLNSYTMTVQSAAAWQGRHWGVYNRPRIPYAKKIVYYLPFGSWCYYVKGRASKTWPALAESKRPSFKLYLENEGQAIGWREWITNAVARWECWQRKAGHDPWQERKEFYNEQERIDQAARRGRSYRQQAWRSRLEYRGRNGGWDAPRHMIEQRARMSHAELSDWDDYIHEMRCLENPKFAARQADRLDIERKRQAELAQKFSTSGAGYDWSRHSKAIDSNGLQPADCQNLTALKSTN